MPWMRVVCVIGCLGVMSASACDKRVQRSASESEGAVVEGHGTTSEASASERSESDRTDEESAAEETSGTSEEAPPASEPEGEPTVMSTDRTLMQALEQRGLGLGERLGAEGATSLRELAAGSGFGDIGSVIEADLREFEQSDPKLGVGVADYPHRLFDPAWLRSPETFFELAGVVSRLDREPFVDGACGEVRLVYRLAYETDHEGRPLRSRLPMTVAVDWRESAGESGDCESAAQRWYLDPELEGEARADAMVAEDGPLASDRIDREWMHRVQVNLQSVRWPSTVHPSLAGHAEYVLRSFVPDEAGGFAVQPLENTPDVEALRQDDALKDELLAWIREPEHLERIDAGTAVLPEKFLADRAISVAPHGLARKKNRPFFRLFDASDFAEVDFEGMEQVRSEAGLVRRLDDQSCAGCHQSRAVAGFHMLGEDRPDTVHANALAVPVSAHATDEQRRRRQLVEEVGDGGEGDFARPFAQRPGVDQRAGYGTPCGLTDDGTFAEWGCARDLECRAYNRSDQAPHVGICLSPDPEVGGPCEIGRMRSREDPVDDRIVSADGGGCPEEAACNKSAVGFPGGMCATDCEAPGENGRCGAIAVLKTFNRCLARDRAFDTCLTEFVRPAGLRACDASTSCRHDYVCAKNADGDGVCIPPYFLFQMRVDGHPQ